MPRKFTTESGQRAARARWMQKSEALSGEPLRETRVIVLAIRYSHRPRTEIRLEAQEGERGWSRFRVEQNGRRIGSRTFGRTAVADLLARTLQ